MGKHFLFQQKNQISDMKIINFDFCSLVSFGSRVGSKCIDHNIHTSRNNNMYSKLTSIHAPINKIETQTSYSRNIWLFATGSL